MKTFEIWAEGYAATGENGPALRLGVVQAENFRDACRVLVQQKPDLKPWFNFATLTFWGCRLFDNEADARKSFG